jgi:DNA end-binding protein Ku
MAPRPYWKGYLRLSLVSCPVALYPATTEREKIRFNQINRNTGHRIRYQKVDADTGEEVEPDDIVKGYEIAKGQYVEITEDELDAVEIESSRTIDIERFVPRTEIDDLYNVRPYYIAPEGDVGFEAFVTIREAIAATKMVAIGRLVLTTREHMIAIEPRDKGLMGTLLRYPYEVRDPAEYFDDIPDIKIDKEMLDLARHIVETKRGHFKPEAFEDRYENALKEIIKRKAKGEKIEAPPRERPSNVISLMDALRRSVEAEGGRGSKSGSTARRPRAAAKSAGKSTAKSSAKSAKTAQRRGTAKKTRKAS